MTNNTAEKYVTPFDGEVYLKKTEQLYENFVSLYIHSLIWAMSEVDWCGVQVKIKFSWHRLPQSPIPNFIEIH
jgi:hypothetical protein